jgi:acyl-CoA synthetase (AMP-forming)/AMP-acid ligase II
VVSDASPSDVACLIYTSGSTAMPKAVVSTHAQVCFAADAIQRRLGYRASDVVYSALPLSFDYGLYQVFLGLLSGARIVLASMAGSGVGLLADLDAHGATVLPAVPSLSKILLLLLRRAGACPSFLRMITNTGAALPQHVADQLRQRIDHLEIVTMFGLTECKRVSISEPNADRSYPGSCGTALPGTRIAIVDEHLVELPPDSIGELVVVGPHVMNGYWNAEELTARKFTTLPNGERMLLTGDMCRMDAVGNLYFEGRRDDLYKQNGFRVSGIEIEAAAMTIPGVHDAAVVPPSEECGSTLWVCADASFNVAAVADGLHTRIERHKMPEHIRRIDVLPLTANGKVDLTVLSASAPA